jgi:hypothetical protein
MLAAIRRALSRAAVSSIIRSTDKPGARAVDWWRRKWKGIAAVAALLLGCPVSSIAQQPADQPSGVAPTAVVGRTAAAIAAEGQRTGTLQTYLDEKLVAEHGYYLWRNGCYIRQQSGDFYSVPLASCQ